MAKPTSQWACIAILALMGSTFNMAHKDVVKPSHTPARSRKLQMGKNSEPEPNNFQASDSDGTAAQHHHPQMDKTEASASGCGGGGSREDRGIFGGGYGCGGTSIGFPNIFSIPGFPFAGLVPQVTTWGDGGGYGGSNNNPDTSVNCPCAHNVFPMHYAIAPVYFQHMNPAPQNNRKDGPAPGPSGN